MTAVNIRESHWTDRLLRKKPKGRAEPALREIGANVAIILANDPAWKGVLGYDTFAEAIAFRRAPPWDPDFASPIANAEWQEEDTTRLQAWMSAHYALDVGPQATDAAVRATALKAPFHPVRDWLASLKWDGKMRLPTLFPDFFGADDTPYTRAIGVGFMVGAVARVMQPGCKLDTVVILEGGQGIGKSSTLRALVGGPDGPGVPRHRDDAAPRRVDWFLEFQGGLDGKDAMQQLRRKWIVELPELDALSRSEAARAKAFFSTQVDTYRASYGRGTRDYPRQCACAGTTNGHTYLRDETGNRRFHPVECRKASPLAIAAARSQLWAEAYARYQSGEAWHIEDPLVLDACREEQELRLQVDPWEEPVAVWLNAQSLPPRAVAGVTTADVLKHALHFEDNRVTRSDETRAGAVLRRIGWVPGKQTTRNGARVRLYRPSRSSQPNEEVECVVVTGVVHPDSSTDTYRYLTPAQPAQPDLRMHMGNDGEEMWVLGDDDEF